MKRFQITIFIIAVFYLFVSIPLIQASWETDGVSVCDTTGNQGSHQIIQDGMGGVIITWVDERLGLDIYAQKIDSLGSSVWLHQGVSICSAANGQNVPWIVSDGAGGAVITWEDGRSGTNSDIYAQRIDKDGSILWTVDGVAVCTALDDQEDPRIATDGAKGAIIVWQDRRNYSINSYDIYAQRVDSTGNSWIVDGVAVCTAMGKQDEPQIAPDGTGGAIIAWMDYRAGFHIYAQRIDADGNPLWAANGIPVCTASGTRYDPKIIPDGSGGAIIEWQDRRYWYDIYAQKIDANGKALWTIDGAPICTATESQRLARLASDGAGGAIIAWQDYRDGRWDIYARRVNSAGDTLWTTHGVPVCTLTNDQYNPQIISDRAGGAVIAWEENRSGADPDIYAQRIDSLGYLLWPDNGVPLCTATAGQNYPRIASDASHGVFVAWVDSRDLATNGTDLYVNSVDDNGQSKVPTLLESYFAKVIEAGVLIHWTLSYVGESVQFFVLRAEMPDGPYRELPAPEIITEGISYTYIDPSCLAGRSYRYRIEVSDEEGRKILFETASLTIPSIALRLEQNYPNPFNPRTTIQFHLPGEAHVNLSVFDLEGKHVVTLLNEAYPQGRHSIQWDGRDSGGNAVSSGVYLYRLKAGKTTLSRKMLLIK